MKNDEKKTRNSGMSRGDMPVYATESGICTDAREVSLSRPRSSTEILIMLASMTEIPLGAGLFKRMNSKNQVGKYVISKSGNHGKR